jgi:ABC-type sugar transport system substrate-binding protein
VSGLEQGGKAGQVKVIGFDVSDETQKAVESGAVYATIMQDQYGCGFHAVRVLAEQARNMKVGLPLYQTHMLAHRAIRKDNLADARHHGKIPQAVPPPGGAEAAAAAAAAATPADTADAAGDASSDAPTTAPSNPAS